MTGTSANNEIKSLLQNIYQMLDLLYHECNPLIMNVVDGSIFLKIFKTNLREKP